jgi:ABC-type Fe3+-siderophore transport system permease subunit
MIEIAAVLLILWLSGLLSGRTFGGILYLLPVISLLLIVAGLFRRRKNAPVEAGAEERRST